VNNHLGAKATLSRLR